MARDVPGTVCVATVVAGLRVEAARFAGALMIAEVGAGSVAGVAVSVVTGVLSGASVGAGVGVMAGGGSGVGGASWARSWIEESAKAAAIAVAPARAYSWWVTVHHARTTVGPALGRTIIGGWDVT